MSMSTSIIGLRDLDGKFAQMMDVKKACDKADVEYPSEVRSYFKDEAEQDERYLECLMQGEINVTLALSLPKEDGSDVYEIDLSKLPKECKKIRFKNSW